MSNPEKAQVIIKDIYAMMERPGRSLLTSEQMRDRADNKMTIANQLRMNGMPVRKEYDALDRTEN